MKRTWLGNSSVAHIMHTVDIRVQYCFVYGMFMPDWLLTCVLSSNIIGALGEPIRWMHMWGYMYMCKSPYYYVNEVIVHLFFQSWLAIYLAKWVLTVSCSYAVDQLFCCCVWNWRYRRTVICQQNTWIDICIMFFSFYNQAKCVSWFDLCIQKVCALLVMIKI